MLQSMKCGTEPATGMADKVHTGKLERLSPLGLVLPFAPGWGVFCFLFFPLQVLCSPHSPYAKQCNVVVM